MTQSGHAASQIVAAQIARHALARLLAPARFVDGDTPAV